MQSDDAPKALTPSELSAAVGISLPYASQILGGKRPLPQALAVKIFRATGRKLGPISAATDDEIDVLERFQGGDA
jgi:DNA-binding transcriptional regulator YdaS (Cro superfamily)